MRTWIFQANPSTFRIEEFVAESSAPFTWLVTRYANEIDIGDRVFLWRSVNRKREMAGIVAEAKVISRATLCASDPEGARYWTNGEDAKVERFRVRLDWVRRGSATRRLPRDMLLEDPILKDLQVIRQYGLGTNFPVSDDESVELEKMWSHIVAPLAAPGLLDIEFEQEVERLCSRPLQDLFDAYTRQATAASSIKPSVRVATTTVNIRNPFVVAIARVRSAGRCEVPGCIHPLFATPSGRLYIEVHHLVPLAENGADEPENVACVCPAHHREAHFGAEAVHIREQLVSIRELK